MEKKAKRLILIGLGLFVLPYVLVSIDVKTGIFSGRPGDTNIGLGLLGLVMWVTGFYFIVKGVIKLFFSLKEIKPKKTKEKK